jgi:signal transduction histidine kinase
MLKKLLSIGFNSNLKGYQRFQLELRNGVAYATLFVILCYCAIHITQQDDPRIYYSHILYIVITISILTLNYFHKYKLVEYVIMTLYPIAFLITALFLGQAYHSEYLLFLSSVGTIYLFNSKKLQFFYFGFNLILFIFIKVHFHFHPEGFVTLNAYFVPILSFLNGLLALVFIFFIIYSSYSYSQLLYKKLKIITANQEDIIAKRTKEIQQKTEELERSNKELKRFAYISAHDLREPLRNILSFSQLLDRSIKAKNYDEIDEYFGFINNSIHRMDTITKDIVNFSELEQYIINAKHVDTNVIVQQVFNDFKTLETDVELISDDLPPILINPKLCKELFENLIENGILYSKKQTPKIEISYTELPNSYQFSIKDDGIGISEEYHETIFVMFKRLQNNIEQHSSGIGLAICQKIVTGYGGKIWVESKKNQGSTFHFTFPKR